MQAQKRGREKVSIMASNDCPNSQKSDWKQLILVLVYKHFLFGFCNVFIIPFYVFSKIQTFYVLLFD